MGVKALAIKVLQGNQRGNRKETQSFLANKNRKPNQELRKPQLDAPRWQHDFCTAHADLNRWRGYCQKSIDDCLISKILDSKGMIANLSKVDIGKSVTTDDVFHQWRESGEPEEDLFKKPMWFICIADYLSRNNK